MSTVTKYQCDHCGKEVADPYLEQGWLKISGSMTRSWGVRKNGRDGDGQADFLKDIEFCGIECLVSAMDALRSQHRGPPLKKIQSQLSKRLDKKPWEDPLPEEDPRLED